jgi:ornithine cyclodeaminase/alanine dehydrogenase-like protein (mu-crystallin family)
LTEQDVAELLTMQECIQAVEDAFVRQDHGLVSNQPRRRLRVPAGLLHCMESADIGLGRMGVKVYTSFKAQTRFLVLLFDTESGEMLAMIEADRLGQMRTGAATGVATRHLAREDSAILCLFGAGWQAETQALGVAAVRKLKHVRVYSRTVERRQAFAERLSRQIDTEVIPADSAESAIDGADIIVTATTSRTPLFDGSLIRSGVHINAVGSNALTKAELDSTTVARADRIVVDSLEQARVESGDLLAAIESNRIRWEELVEVHEVVAGRRPGRSSSDEVTLFKSNGLALEDIAAASIVYDRALERKLGREIRLWS